MKPYIIKNLLSQSQIDEIKLSIKTEKDRRPLIYFDNPREDPDQNKSVKINAFMGRLDIENLPVSNSIVQTVTSVADDVDGPNIHHLAQRGIMAVEYSGKYGRPVLRSHLDGGISSLMVNYQLESNTSWDICIDDQIYTLEDNDALIMDPVRQLHSRLDKDFTEEQFVNMVFFRFGKKE